MTTSQALSMPASAERPGALTFHFRWPSPTPNGEQDNFFLGLWHPHRCVQVTPATSAGDYVTVGDGPWWLASARSRLHSPHAGLVHADPSGACAVAFRGYLVSPALHSYSEPADLLKHWTSPGPRPNGVFAAAIVTGGGARLTLMTDALGLATLYYRRIGEAVVFATNPRYLASDGDTADMLAWRSLLETEFIAGERSLTSAIQRVPLGKRLVFSAREERTVTWFDFGQLPDGRRRIDRRGLADMEEMLQEAVRRCLALQAGDHVLPLSSGHDSRRILAAFLAHKAEFVAITARGYQREYRDLDAPFASQIAAAYGFPHHIAEPTAAQAFLDDDRRRRLLVDAETPNHTWFLPLFDALPPRPSVLFDGILGDILGHPGFRLPDLYQSPENDLRIILEHSVQGTFDRELNARLWPSAADVRADLRLHWSQFLGKSNLAELAFIVTRQRRGTALWAQQLLGPGHVVVCPYADLDYLTLMLSFFPRDKHATVCQRACLEAFWPDLARFPGNRDIPASLPPGSPARTEARGRAALRAMLKEIDAQRGGHRLHELLSARGAVRLELSRRLRGAATRSRWCLNPLLELVARDVSRQSCWHAETAPPPILVQP